ncbi:uncharacterized protein J3R85_011303 [Psidium guajava]|nr:uncharacterized protein J3R85_011303 [Psidium guajava]
MQCSGRIGKGGFATGPGRPVNNGLLKNLSISSVGSSFVSEEDLRDLIRDASTRGHLNGLIQMDLLLQKHPKTNGISTAAALGYVPRSFTTGIGRIDEDKPCEFEDNDIRIDAIVRPRSRSHAVSWRRA